MICQQCLLRLRSTRAAPSRFISSSASLRAEPVRAPRGPPSGSHEGPSAATSTSAAQPFTTPTTYAELPQQPAISTPARIASSVKAGTVFKSLGFFKNRDPPVAMEDHEYPDWLWTLLDDQRAASKRAAGSDNDLYAKSKRMRLLARKAERKAARLSQSDPAANMPQIPLEQQTIDLPAGDGTADGAVAASKARDDLTAAMRQARRKSIKERNFLTGMR